MQFRWVHFTYTLSSYPCFFPAPLPPPVQFRWAALANIDRTMTMWRQQLLVVMITCFILYPAWATVGWSGGGKGELQGQWAGQGAAGERPWVRGGTVERSKVGGVWGGWHDRALCCDSRSPWCRSCLHKSPCLPIYDILVPPAPLPALPPQAALQIFACVLLDDGSAGQYPQHQAASWGRGYWISNM